MDLDEKKNELSIKIKKQKRNYRILDKMCKVNSKNVPYLNKGRFFMS